MTLWLRYRYYTRPSPAGFAETGIKPAGGPALSGAARKASALTLADSWSWGP